MKIRTRHGYGQHLILGKSISGSVRVKFHSIIIFSDPNEPTGVIQQFCVRFKNAEIAGTFKTAFEECQNKLLDAPGFTPGREVRILELR